MTRTAVSPSRYELVLATLGHRGSLFASGVSLPADSRERAGVMLNYDGSLYTVDDWCVDEPDEVTGADAVLTKRPVCVSDSLSGSYAWYCEERGE
jgi:hypothetical protein